MQRRRPRAAAARAARPALLAVLRLLAAEHRAAGAARADVLDQRPEAARLAVGQLAVLLRLHRNDVEIVDNVRRWRHVERHDVIAGDVRRLLLVRCWLLRCGPRTALRAAVWLVVASACWR